MVTTEPRSAPQHPREGEVVAALRERTALTRAEIAETTGLSRSTVSSVLGTLLEEGAVVIAGYDEQPGRGRPTERVQIDRRVVRSVGVDFGHGKVRAVALSLLGDELLDSSVAHNDLIDWPQRRELVQQVLDDLALPTDLPALRGVGLGLSGPTPLPPNGTGPWQPIVADLADRFGVPVQVDNTTRFAAFAEHRAASTSSAITLHLRCFQGVGGAVVRDGRIDHGATGMAGEIGHLQVEQPGVGCRCGKYGCLETVASTPAMLAHCRDRSLPITTIAELRQAVAQRHDHVLPLRQHLTHALAHALVVAATLVDPDEIILSGDVLDRDDTLLIDIYQVYAAALGDRFRPAPIVHGRLDGRAGALGAALGFAHPSTGAHSAADS
ncbi:MAG TPA: ROK family transcriptional regulator [Ruania sp.]|nr:ROK family transcriptional regulator [Ruania sp.]